MLKRHFLRPHAGNPLAPGNFPANSSVGQTVSRAAVPSLFEADPDDPRIHRDPPTEEKDVLDGTRRLLIAALLIHLAITACFLPRVLIHVLNAWLVPVRFFSLAGLAAGASVLFVWAWWRRRRDLAISFCVVTICLWLSVIWFGL